jgi:hypothetical protein
MKTPSVVRTAWMFVLTSTISVRSMEHLHGTSFDWLTWGGGSLTELGIQYNELHVVHMRSIIRRYAIGWGYGEDCLCRPKSNRMAVMFLKDDRIFWTHLTSIEFAKVFPEIELNKNYHIYPITNPF